MACYCYMCLLCGYMYNEGIGDRVRKLPPTDWQNLPDDWCCPDCGADKSKFEGTEADFI